MELFALEINGWQDCFGNYLSALGDPITGTACELVGVYADRDQAEEVAEELDAVSLETCGGPGHQCKRYRVCPLNVSDYFPQQRIQDGHIDGDDVFELLDSVEWEANCNLTEELADELLDEAC